MAKSGYVGPLLMHVLNTHGRPDNMPGLLTYLLERDAEQELTGCTEFALAVSAYLESRETESGTSGMNVAKSGA
jgi:hypothetical protein